MKKGYFTSTDRAYAFNETNVAEWFKQYQQLLVDLGIKSGRQILNCDEVRNCVFYHFSHPLFPANFRFELIWVFVSFLCFFVFISALSFRLFCLLFLSVACSSLDFCK
jgi:hypothetical protein